MHQLLMSGALQFRLCSGLEPAQFFLQREAEPAEHLNPKRPTKADENLQRQANRTDWKAT